MTHHGIYYTEDFSNATEMVDYNLIEMFLDLILMVKIEESLNTTQSASPSTPTPVTELIQVTSETPAKVYTVTTSLIPTPASIILNSFSSTDNAQGRLVVDTSSSKLFPIITSTTLSLTISTRTPFISTAA